MSEILCARSCMCVHMQASMHTRAMYYYTEASDNLLTQCLLMTQRPIFLFKKFISV